MAREQTPRGSQKEKSIIFHKFIMFKKHRTK